MFISILYTQESVIELWNEINDDVFEIAVN